MKYLPLFILCWYTLSGCVKNCNEDLRIGQQVQIPLDLSDFSSAERALLQLKLIGISDSFTHPIDNYLLSYHEAGDIYYLSDHAPDGYYSSDLDGRSIYFMMPDTSGQYQEVDSMTNIVLKKSQEEVDDPCYKDHPNIQIDELSYIHDGQKRDENYTLVLSR